MNYSIEMEGKEFNLEPYTIGIMDEVEAIEAKNNGSGKIREKMKSMYDFVVKVAEGAADYLGEFKDCDPNKINLMYLRIIRLYNSPVEEYEKEDRRDRMNEESIDKALEMLNALSKFDSLKGNK